MQAKDVNDKFLVGTTCDRKLKLFTFIYGTEVGFAFPLGTDLALFNIYIDVPGENIIHEGLKVIEIPKLRRLVEETKRRLNTTKDKYLNFLPLRHIIAGIIYLYLQKHEAEIIKIIEESMKK